MKSLVRGRGVPSPKTSIGDVSPSHLRLVAAYSYVGLSPRCYTIIISAYMITPKLRIKGESQ